MLFDSSDFYGTFGKSCKSSRHGSSIWKVGRSDPFAQSKASTRHTPYINYIGVCVKILDIQRHYLDVWSSKKTSAVQDCQDWHHTWSAGWGSFILILILMGIFSHHISQYENLYKQYISQD